MMMLVRFRPDDPTLTCFAGKDASPGLRIPQWNNANGDLEVVLDLFFYFSRSIPMGEREAPMNFRFGGIFWGKEIVEVVF